MFPGDNVDGSSPIDWDVIHLEEMCCPGAGAYLVTVAFISVSQSSFLVLINHTHARINFGMKSNHSL